VDAILGVQQQREKEERQERERERERERLKEQRGRERERRSLVKKERDDRRRRIAYLAKNKLNLNSFALFITAKHHCQHHPIARDSQDSQAWRMVRPALFSSGVYANGAVNMIDESVAPQASHDDVDTWIEMLMNCKQLSEADVKKLCDKVFHSLLYRPC
jgi:hypothetical protein